MMRFRACIAALLAGVAPATALARDETPHIRVEGDFDGDGAEDAAELAHGPDGFRLIILPGAADADLVMVLSGPADRAPDYLELAPPGDFRTTRAGPGDPPSERIETAFPGFIYGTQEASSALVYWTGETYRVVALTD